MIFKSVNVILVSFVLLTSSIASAGLIVDTANDSFIDTTTSIEWMDFGINNGESFNFVASQLGTGGKYFNWMLPTKEQVYAMWATAFLNLGADVEEPNNTGTGQLYASDGGGVFGSVFTNIFQSMGYNSTYSQNTGNELYQSLGWFVGTDGLSYVSSNQYSDRIGIGFSPDNVTLYDSVNYDANKNYNNNTYSTLLIKKDTLNSTTVSEPTTLAIFALAIMGLASRRYKRKG
ncbi:MAG: hypothetical protein COB83_11425 [Gammaproteobacteria bacterium]|nr:MAG: hypothetical protein COB83_11425 [Gammaproteobacteria bacterium]